MKTLANLGAGLLAAALFASALLAPALAQTEHCLTPREIQTAIESGQVQPLAAILAAAGISDEPLSVQLCRQPDGRLFYVVAVLGPTGDAQNLVLNAHGATL